MRTLTRDHLERKSLRTLGRNKGQSKTTVMKTMHTVTKCVKDVVWITKRFQPLWGGILVVDGKGVRVFEPLAKTLKHRGMSSQEYKRLHRKVWICGIDFLTGDLPNYALADEETKVDLVMYFRRLKNEIHYKLTVLVCDGNEDIVFAARKVYGQTFLVQRCVRHYLEGLKLRAGRLGVLDHPRTFDLIQTIHMVIMARDLTTAHVYLEALKRKRFSHPIHKTLLQDFYRDVDTLTTHLQYPDLNIPRTNNDIENLFRQLNQRLTSICRFGSFTYAQNYLTAWTLMRRFTPFTDCKGHRRSRNGKTPLELAGCDATNCDYLDL